MLKTIFGENLTFDALVGDVLYRGFCIFETDGRTDGWACTHALTDTHRQTDRQKHVPIDKHTVRQTDTVNHTYIRTYVHARVRVCVCGKPSVCLFLQTSLYNVTHQTHVQYTNACTHAHTRRRTNRIVLKEATTWE